MPFRRDMAAATLISVASALHATGATLTPRFRSPCELIRDAGYDIFRQSRANRADSISRLLDKIAELPDLPQDVIDALAAGQAFQTRHRAGDRQTARPSAGRACARCTTPAATATTWPGRGVARPHYPGKGQLDPDTRAKWEQIDAVYDVARHPERPYLDRPRPLLGDRLPFVREALDASKPGSRFTCRWPGLPPRPQTGGIGPVDGRGRGCQDESAPRRTHAAHALPAAPALVQRSANVYFPSTVRLAQVEVPLIVHIARAAATGTVTVTQGSSSITVAVGDLRLFVHTLDFDITTDHRRAGDSRCALRPHSAYRPDRRLRAGDLLPPPVSRDDRGQEANQHRVHPIGEALGSLVFEVGHARRAPRRPSARMSVDNSRSPFGHGAGGGRDDAPDLDLRVACRGTP